MKTIKLTRQFSMNKDIWDQLAAEDWDEIDWIDEKGAYFLCMRELRQLFRINKKAKQLWINFRKTPARGFHEASRSGQDAYCVHLDNRAYSTYCALGQLLTNQKIGVGEKFYFNIEYKS